MRCNMRNLATLSPLSWGLFGGSYVPDLDSCILPFWKFLEVSFSTLLYLTLCIFCPLPHVSSSCPLSKSLQYLKSWQFRALCVVSEVWSHQPAQITYNWISTFLVSKAFPVTRELLSSLAWDPELPFSWFQILSSFPVSPKPHKSMFFSCAEEFCYLCLSPISFKLCQKGTFHTWKGTSGFCILPIEKNNFVL